ncbi:TetR/AcrR family transcriptional regulator [Streptomyces longispororuber]|uniref:TetR/AcrR family transcriptional regulator n=1 Tax=Streptomyces longispororuber TaxID=68230 RepID=UPI00210CDCFC|nr:TetR family transcriptional regulator [Streptomyces longispororuber]MCQ4206443.1 TetR/AcrR family transcriptional regulator [Streptomyces longispororuber]
MGRVSKVQAQENRKRIVDTASRLFREQGTHVSVADLMQAAGLTHGGFYKQFASKEALVDEATGHAFTELTARRNAALAHHTDQGSARQSLIDAYLSTEHRDNAADGCPVAGLATDIARTPGDHEARQVFTEGVADFAAWLGGDSAGDSGSSHRDAERRDDGIAQLCTLFGAIVLARATTGSPLSEEILRVAHQALTTDRGSGPS